MATLRPQLPTRLPRASLPAIARAALVPAAAAVAVGALLHLAISRWILRSAEERVQNVLLTQRGLHEYIQRVMHPEFYRALRSGDLPPDYYSPALFSSTYMARLLHGFYNEERQQAGLAPIDYHLAALNPRNPVNRASAGEAALIRRFDADRSLREVREVVDVGGRKYLLYAMPFLPVGEPCLRCHGRRADAPPGVRTLYPGDGGFDEPVGHIRAVEVLRAPVESDLLAAWVATGSASAGVVALLALVLFTGRLRASVRDRTATLRAEVEERRRTEGELAQLKDYLANIVDSMPSGLLAIDAAGAVTQWNRRAERVSGRSAAAAIGRPVEEVLPELAEPIARLRAGAGPFHAAPLRASVAGRDGRTRSYDLLAYPLVAGGTAVGTAIRIDDVTTQVEIEGYLARAQRLDAVGTLAGGIAHDFNNLLAGILGSVITARESAPAGSEADAALADAAQATRRAAELTRQLLALSRGGAPVRTAVSLPELLEETTRFALHGTPCTSRLELAPDLWAVDADPGQLAQVVQNLVINARQAMPGGGCVVVRARNRAVVPPERLPPGRHVEIEVADEGVGIASGDLDRIFDPFYTTKPEGHGLGLATVHAIVERHGGWIGVRSEPGRGATFTILLPAADGAARSAEEAVPAPGIAPGTRVLLLDDEPVLRRSVARMLRRLGCECVASADGADAAERYRQELASGRRFDVVIGDLIVPGGVGGREAAEAILAVDPAARVILSTGYAEAPDGAAPGDARIRAWLPKPYDLDDLRRALATALA